MNRATRTIVSALGVALGIAGLDHGFFEAFQGNLQTPGLFIQAIGPANRMWIYGTEDAFTLVPNFLITGILAMTVSLVMMIWCLGFIHKQNGVPVFIMLCVLLFLVGGGVAEAFMFIPAWVVASQVNRPLTGWRKILSKSAGWLAHAWPFSLAIGSMLFLMALEIAIAGFVPGVNDPNLKQYICWSLLGIAFGAFFLTFLAGFANDIQTNGMVEE
jgi:hypothetical protein